MTGPQGASLGKYGSNLNIPGQGPVDNLWPLMRWLWKSSSLEGLQKCHRVRYGPNVDVYVSAAGGAFFAGFCRCHSVWACPLCAPVIRAGRAREMAGGLRQLVAGGGGCLFTTLTLPHSQGDRLSALFDAVADSWRRVQVARSVKAFRADHGMEFSRSTEVTHGSNGWHPHLHVGEVCPEPLTRADVLEYRQLVFSAWCEAVERAGYRTPSDRYGVSMIRADAGMADYSHKVEGLADELFRLDTKRAGKTRPPFEILRAAVAGDERSAVVWREYETFTQGRRMLGQSRGFKRLCPVVEATDDELVNDTVGMAYMGTLRPEGANMLVAHPRGFEGFAELVGPGTPEAWAAACAWLRGTAPLWMTQAGIDELFGVGQADELVELVEPDSLPLVF